MKKIYRSLLIATLIFFFQLIFTKNFIFAQTYYHCTWDYNTCTQSQSCPAGCQAVPSCASLTQYGAAACCSPNPAANVCTGQRECDCHPTEPPAPTSALHLQDLYPAIQSMPGTHFFNFNQPVGGIISALLNFIFPIAGLILLIFLIIGGFNFMLSGGDPKKAQAAKSIITTAFAGFIIIFLAYWIVQIVAIVLGLGKIQTIFSP